MPIATDPDKIRILGSGHVFLAEVTDDGPELPADIGDVPGALDALLLDVGFTDDAGVDMDYKPDVGDILALQASGSVKRYLKGQAWSVDCKMLESSQDAIEISFGGGVWSATDTGQRFDPPIVGSSLKKYCLVLLYTDGDEKWAWVSEAGNASAEVKTTAKRGDPVEWMLHFDALSLSDGTGRLALYLLATDGIAPAIGS